KHIVKSPGVGFLLGDLVRAGVGIVQVPGVIAQLLGIVAEIVRRLTPGAASVFPLGLGGQSIGLACLGRKPASILLGGMMGNVDCRMAFAAEAERLISVRRRGTCDCVRGFLV